ncbi:P-selectin-like isoform X3 [Haemaphysalis longicornis]
MEPHGWQGGVLVPVILLLALQVLPSVADCQHDDLSDYTEHTEPVYGATNKDTYGEGETVQYMCQGGFYPKAPGPVTQYRTAVCRNGRWDKSGQSPLTCVGVSCGNPFPGGSLSNGRPDSLVFNFPSIIKVTCNPGYRLVAHDGSEWGTKILSCQSNGQWNRQAPKCMQVVCQPTRDIPHGRVIHSPAGGPLHENATATYQCSGKNYVLKGPAVRRCQNDGTWSDTEPICQGFDGCVKPDLPNGRVVAVKAEMLGNISYYPYDTTVILACDDGSKTSSKCLPLGSWNPEPPVCSATKTPSSSSSSTTTTTTTTTTTRAPATQCSPLSSPASGRLFSVDGFRINASVVFSCDEGYTLRGPSTLVCRPSGAWDPPTTPTCTAPPPWIIILSVCLAVLASLVLCCLGFFYIMRRRRRRTPPAQGYRRQIRKPGPYDAISNDEVARLGKPLPTTSL